MSTFTIYAKGSRALLLSDTAGCDGEGIVRAWSSKVITLPHLRMAITTRGAMAALPNLAIDLCGRFASFDEMVTSDGAEFIAEAHENHLMNWTDLAGAPEFDLALVGWSASRRQCEAYAISSLDHPGLPAFTFMRQEYLLAPAPDQSELMRAGLWSNGGVVPGEPQALLRRIIEIQRGKRVAIGGIAGAPEVNIVGGQCVATEITEAGISQRVAHTWPDKIGERIRPAPAVAATAASIPAAGMSRQQRRAALAQARKEAAHAH